METTEGFAGWAILELMGHRKLAGRVSEERGARFSASTCLGFRPRMTRIQ